MERSGEFLELVRRVALGAFAIGVERCCRPRVEGDYLKQIAASRLDHYEHQSRHSKESVSPLSAYLVT